MMKMSSPIGINLRVTGYCSQGGRKYMEDTFSVAYQDSDDEKNLEYAFFGVYDGHGGAEAANFAREHLMDSIVEQKLFWSDNDDDVLRAIREGYIATHYAMWREQDKWPKTSSGLPSTAGTTASVAFVRRGKLYIGHVGDSGIVLGYQEEGENFWRAQPLTQDHKPECHIEKARIMNSGGKVMVKSGVPRVVWNRPRIGHKGPVRRSTPIDEIPFLAVARSLGDLWSYNSELNEFVVSPDPDVQVVKIDPKKFRCLVFGTDGLWNVLSAVGSVAHIRTAEEMNQEQVYGWTNPSKYLVQAALDKCRLNRLRADNISVVAIMLYPPGPPGVPFNSNVVGEESSQIEPEQDVNTMSPIHAEYSNELNHFNEDKNVTLYDHSTRVWLSLENEIGSGDESSSSQSKSIEIMNENFEKSTDDVCYMNSFAEFYENSLYGNPQEVHQIQQQQTIDTNTCSQQLIENIIESSDFNAETYSLTKLQTRTEQMNAINTEEYTNDSHFINGFPHPLGFHDYHRPMVDQNDELPGTSHIKITTLQEKRDKNLSVVEENVEKNGKTGDSGEGDSIEDEEAIQIHEISSSSIVVDREKKEISLVDQQHNHPKSPAVSKPKIVKKRMFRKRRLIPIINNFEPPCTRSKDSRKQTTNAKQTIIKKSTRTKTLKRTTTRNIQLTKVQKKLPVGTTQLRSTPSNDSTTQLLISQESSVVLPTIGSVGISPYRRVSTRQNLLNKITSSSKIVKNLSRRILTRQGSKGRSTTKSRHRLQKIMGKK